MTNSGFFNAFELFRKPYARSLLLEGKDKKGNAIVDVLSRMFLAHASELFARLHPPAPLSFHFFSVAGYVCYPVAASSSSSHLRSSLPKAPPILFGVSPTVLPRPGYWPPQVGSHAIYERQDDDRGVEKSIPYDRSARRVEAHQSFRAEKSVLSVDLASLVCAGRRVWVLVFPKTVIELSASREAGQIPYGVRGGRKASVRRWSGVDAGAWAGEGTALYGSVS